MTWTFFWQFLSEEYSVDCFILSVGHNCIPNHFGVGHPSEQDKDVVSGWIVKLSFIFHHVLHLKRENRFSPFQGQPKELSKIIKRHFPTSSKRTPKRTSSMVASLRGQLQYNFTNYIAVSVPLDISNQIINVYFQKVRKHPYFHNN